MKEAHNRFIETASLSDYPTHSSLLQLNTQEPHHLISTFFEFHAPFNGKNLAISAQRRAARNLTTTTVGPRGGLRDFEPPS